LFSQQSFEFDGVKCAFSGERAFFRIYASVIENSCSRASWVLSVFSCRHGSKVRTTVLRANGTHWRSAAGRMSSNCGDSGRWKHYYETQDELAAALRDAVTACDEWARLGGLPEGDASA
jgi:hypothetical protein